MAINSPHDFIGVELIWWSMVVRGRVIEMRKMMISNSFEWQWGSSKMKTIVMLVMRALHEDGESLGIDMRHP